MWAKPIIAGTYLVGPYTRTSWAFSKNAYFEPRSPNYRHILHVALVEIFAIFDRARTYSEYNPRTRYGLVQ